MKPMLTIALAAALFAGLAAPSLADGFDANEAYQEAMIGRMASEAGVESASAQLRAMLGAERRREARPDGIAALFQRIFLVEPDARREAHDGAALVTGDYEHSRDTVYCALEAERGR